MRRDVAEQVAELLNRHNNLQTKYNGDKVLGSKARYLPEYFAGIVFGNVAVHRHTFLLSEIKHLVVHPLFRGFGLGRALLEKAISAVDTPLMYATVKENNGTSLRLFVRAGFKEIVKVPFEDYRLSLLMKLK